MLIQFNILRAVLHVCINSYTMRHMCWFPPKIKKIKTKLHLTESHKTLFQRLSETASIWYFTKTNTNNNNKCSPTHTHRKEHSILWPNGKTAFEFRFNPIVKCDLNLPMETLESNAMRGVAKGCGRGRSENEICIWKRGVFMRAAFGKFIKAFHCTLGNWEL